MSRSDTTRAWPQGSLEGVLEAHDRDHVRPALAGEDVGDGLPIHSAGSSRLAQAPSPCIDPRSQRQCDVLDNTGRRVLNLPVGPPIRISGVLTGGRRSAQSCRHQDALLTITVEDEGGSGYLASRWEWVMYVERSDADRIRAYRPHAAKVSDAQWARIQGPVRVLVTAVVGRVPYGVDDLLYIATKVAVFAEESGLPDDPAVWLLTENIDRFIVSRYRDRHFGPASAETYRTYLRRMREAMVWVDRGEAPSPRLHVPRDPSAPYAGAELAKLDAWAAGLPDRERWDAHALLCLGAGCGLARAKAIAVTGADICVLKSGMVLVTAGPEGLPIACVAKYEQRLAELARVRAGSFVFRPGRQVEAAKNLVSNWTARHVPPKGTPKLSLARLRSTWIVGLMARRIDRELIAEAAGLQSSAQLAKYAKWVPPMTSAEANQMLRGTT